MKLKNIILTFAVTGLASLGLATTSHAATTVTVAAPNGNSVYVTNTDKGPGGYLGALIKRSTRTYRNTSLRRPLLHKMQSLQVCNPGSMMWL